MDSYSEKDVFSSREMSLFRVSTAIVAAFPSSDYQDRPLRCHEVARALGGLLQLEVQDGFYGFVDHTWLWTSPLRTDRLVGRIGFPNILDPYSVGSMPPVRLVAGGHTGLPHIGWSYRPVEKHEWEESVVEDLKGRVYLDDALKGQLVEHLQVYGRE